MNSEREPSWKEAFSQIIYDARIRRLFLLGFSAGLPILLVYGTLSAWMREAGLDLSDISLVSLVTLAYSLKVIWAPLVDSLPVPIMTRIFGRRRSWMLVAQIGIMVGLLGLAFSDPAVSLEQVVWLALLVAFSSATQDIVIDAYRIDCGDVRLQGLLSAAYVWGYRLGMFVASAVAFWIADAVDLNVDSYEPFPWMVTYALMALFMLVGVYTALYLPRLDGGLSATANIHSSIFQRILAWLFRAVIGPFKDFIKNYRWLALLILSLVATYRIPDAVMGVMANIFYLDIGFSKGDIATVTKVFGLAMTLIGTALGGVAIYRLGVMPVLVVGVILSAATNILFSILAMKGPDYWLFVGVISLDNLSAGVANAAFIAYLSNLTNVSYSATQYALFSSLMTLIPTLIGGFAGKMVNAVDYPLFFTGTALMGVPVLVLVLLAWRYTDVTKRV